MGGPDSPTFRVWTEVLVLDCNKRLLPLMAIGRNERLTTCRIVPESWFVAVAACVKKSASSVKYILLLPVNPTGSKAVGEEGEEFC